MGERLASRRKRGANEPGPTTSHPVESAELLHGRATGDRCHAVVGDRDGPVGVDLVERAAEDLGNLLGHLDLVAGEVHCSKHCCLAAEECDEFDQDVGVHALEGDDVYRRGDDFYRDVLSSSEVGKSASWAAPPRPST